MTARQVYEAVLVEMNKVQAPSLLLENFNYLFNKAINQYINKRYNIYDVNQQTTDDLRVLKSSVTLRALNDKSPINDVTVRDSMYGAIYEFALPVDYLHLLNCVCNFKVNKPFKCYNANTYVQFAAQRLTSDMWSQIINNFYMRPTYKRPYYFIHNVNSFPADSQWNAGTWSTDSLSSPTGGIKTGGKINFEGNFGRVPSENIYIPTDGGNTDIQHLKKLYEPGTSTEITSRYGHTYTDDNNHYDADYKYGIPRYLDFSNIEITENNNVWRRTGRGRIVATVDITGDGVTEKDIVLGDINFTPKQYDNTDTIPEGYSVGDFVPYNNTESNGMYSDMKSPIKITWNSSVVKQLGTNVQSNLTGAVGQSIYNGKGSNPSLTDIATTLQYVVSGNNVQVGDSESTSIRVIWEWVPLLKHEKFDSVEKVGEVRYGNPSTVRLEIRYGKFLDYILFLFR